MNKDKRLIIHIGMSRTATTNLQRGLFPLLHNDGVINYLGKADNMYNKINNGEIVRENFEKIINYILYNKGENSCDNNIIKPGILNILSDERICCSTYRLKTWGNNIDDSISIPKKIYNYFNSEASQIIILLTIRNQQTLIPSSFARLYSIFLNNPENESMKNYFAYNINEISLEHYLYFFLENKNLFNWYYDKLISSYIQYFSRENIKVLFFEDYLYNKDFYIEELSNVIKISKDRISSSLEGLHFHRDVHNNEEMIISVNQKKLLQKTMKSVYKNSIIHAVYRPVKKHWPDNFLSRLYKHKTNKSYLIKNLTSKQKKIIFNKFQESNLKLYTEFGICRNKLKKYGYI